MKAVNNILIVGSGGREHALVLALAKSQYVKKIFVALGNIGIAESSEKVELVPIKETELDRLLSFALKHKIDLTIVGPEVPLAMGIVDLFSSRDLLIFGPSKAAAQIEVSKDFAKQIMLEANVPTAGYKSFTDYDEALDYIQDKSLPVVIKYDGLAAGKGVVIAESKEEAQQTLQAMLSEDKYDEPKVVIEEFLIGEEFSLFAFVRGEEVFPMSAAKDHKRVFDNDEGPNTGGMGAYSPVPFVTREDEDFVREQVLKPVAKALVQKGCAFNGLLYAGLIKTAQGIKVIEFNCRFGDPETEVLLPRLQTDLFEICYAIAQGNSKNKLELAPVPELLWSKMFSIGFVLASKGYPGDYTKGKPIQGLNLEQENLYACHMGTARNQEGLLCSSGGRVLMIYALDEDPQIARNKALSCIEEIKGDDFHFRRDIGLNL